MNPSSDPPDPRLVAALNGLAVEAKRKRSPGKRPNRRLASKRVRDDDRLLKRVSKIRVLLV